MGNAKTEREKRRRARKRGVEYKPPAPRPQPSRAKKMKSGTGQPGEANWDHPCDNCGQLPTVEPVGLCGPCTFGEADTMGGNW